MENRACSWPEEIFQSVQVFSFFVPEGHRRLGGGETTGCDRKPPREPLRAGNRFLHSLPVGTCAPPPAIIHYASTAYHKLAKGLVRDLPQLAAQKQITHPALIIIGQVTDL